MAKLSVIVPVYNVKNYIFQCLESINNQTYKDIEIIVVDDGSTDGSGKFVDEYCNEKDQFIVYHKENGGLMSAWYYGVEKSSGDYIGFVDSDDMICADMYDIMMQTAIDTNADIVMCGRHDITKTTEKDALGGLDSLYDERNISYVYDHVFPSLRGGNISSARWNKVFKREVFVPNMKYCIDKSRYCEDRYIVPACLLTAKTFAYVDKPLYIYRMRKTANSKSPSKDLGPSLERLYKIQSQMLKDKGVYERYSKQLELAKLNYLKILYERNLVQAKGFNEKFGICKQMLSIENRAFIINHKKDCVNKFGKVLFFSAKYNFKLVLLFFSYINRIVLMNTKGDWFD